MHAQVNQENPATRRTCLALGAAMLLCVLLCAQSLAGTTIDALVARVNNKGILLSEIMNVVPRGPIKKKDWDEAMNMLIVQSLIEQIAEREKVTVEDEQVEEALRERLKSVGLTIEQVQDQIELYRRQVKQYLRRQKLIALKIRHQVNVTPEQVREYYDTHQADYRVPEKRRLRIISVRIEQTNDPQAARKAAEEKIQSVLQQLREGNDFALVARRESNDTYTEKGGDWGWRVRGGLDGKLEEVAFSLDVGQTSGVIETPQGFAIARVEERQPEFLKPFEEVRKGIKERLTQTQFEERAQEYIDQLVKTADIQYFMNGPEE